MFFQLRRELFGELRVPVVHHNVGILGSILGLFKERFRLLHHPCGIGMLGAGRNDSFS